MPSRLPKLSWRNGGVDSGVPGRISRACTERDMHYSCRSAASAKLPLTTSYPLLSKEGIKGEVVNLVAVGNDPGPPVDMP